MNTDTHPEGGPINPHACSPEALAQRAADAPILSIRNLSKRFGAIEVLKDISIDIAPGEIFSLLGPSGCGKSTLLRLVAGFETPTDGTIHLDGKDMSRLPPNRRPVNMVFQSYAVFPHMNVRDNVAYGLVTDRVARTEIDARVGEALDQVQLAGFADRKPGQLSGGQRQRVALARALVKRPRLLLLDEPLSALDAKLRDAMRLELVKLQESVGITFIIVTHDQSEAMAMSDRIAVLEGGRLRQVDSPSALYRRPKDAFVADFIGSVHAFDVNRIDTVDGGLALDVGRIGEVGLACPLPRNCNLGKQGSSGAVLVVRPEHVRVTLDEPPVDSIPVTGQLGDIAFQGSQSIVEILLADGTAMTAIVDEALADDLQRAGAGSPVTAWWSIDDMRLLPRRADKPQPAA